MFKKLKEALGPKKISSDELLSVRRFFNKYSSRPLYSGDECPVSKAIMKYGVEVREFRDTRHDN